MGMLIFSSQPGFAFISHLLVFCLHISLKNFDKFFESFAANILFYFSLPFFLIEFCQLIFFHIYYFSLPVFFPKKKKIAHFLIIQDNSIWAARPPPLVLKRQN